MQTVLVLGGYGFFGTRICAALKSDASIRLLIGGRDLNKAQSFARSLGLDEATGIQIDAADPRLSEKLRILSVDVLVHAAGPFQGQDYSVARAAIEAGCHYIDLADGRDFVAGIGSLDMLAKEKGVSIIAGASSVPALSSSVVEKYLPRFAKLDSIEIGISTGARTPGIAAVIGIFSYVGKPFQRLEKGYWRTTHGWHDLKQHTFPAPLGSRLLGSCDVPDLVIFPKRYATVQTVTFHAGFGSALGHLVVWAIGGLVRIRLISTAKIFALALNRLSRRIESWISDRGGMFVRLRGMTSDGRNKTINWHLIASQNHGPHIPCGASIALVRKLCAGEAIPRGAMPCVGLVSVAEYLAPLKDLDVRELADE